MFKPNYFQIENIYINTFNQKFNKIFSKYIHRYMFINDNDNDNKIEKLFQKARLTTQWASKENCSKISWSITLMWDSGQI